ncbi:MAG: GNAT family N-acetyltransferase, partial [Bacteroidota bacterium]
MKGEIIYATNRATKNDIEIHLKHCDTNFIPPLSSRLVISDYAGKIVEKSFRFEAWKSEALIGLVAIYFSNKNNAYITNVSVLPDMEGKGIAKELMNRIFKYAITGGYERINLEVSMYNQKAIVLYRNLGFHFSENINENIKML